MDLIELYKASDSERKNLVATWYSEELTKAINETANCITIAKKLLVVYESRQRQENTSKIIFVALWRLINRKAKDNAVENYNNTVKEIASLEEKSEYLNEFLNIEIAEILKMYPTLNSDNIVVRTNAIKIMIAKLSKGISPILIEKAEKTL